MFNNAQQLLKNLLNQNDNSPITILQELELKEELFDKQIEQQRRESSNKLHQSIRLATKERNKRNKAIFGARNTIHYKKTNQLTKDNKPIYTDGKKQYILGPNFQMKAI